jgi:uncharacterized DUF497 family protein
LLNSIKPEEGLLVKKEFGACLLLGGISSTLDLTSLQISIYIIVGYRMGKTIISADRRFEWDADKSRTNKELHGLSFDEVLSAFDDPYLLELYDETHSTLEETRYIGLAELRDIVILYLSYMEPANGRTRIISVRPAEPVEERMYYEWRKNFIA